jgi:hypothetical protein
LSFIIFSVILSLFCTLLKNIHSKSKNFNSPTSFRLPLAGDKSASASLWRCNDMLITHTAWESPLPCARSPSRPTAHTRIVERARTLEKRGDGQSRFSAIVVFFAPTSGHKWLKTTPIIIHFILFSLRALAGDGVGKFRSYAPLCLRCVICRFGHQNHKSAHTHEFASAFNGRS